MGYGDWSSVLRVDVGLQPSQPLNVRTTCNVQRTSTTIQWDVPASDNGWPVSGYRVSIRTLDAFGQPTAGSPTDATFRCQESSSSSNAVQQYVTSRVCTIPLSVLEDNYGIRDGDAIFAAVSARN